MKGLILSKMSVDLFAFSGCILHKCFKPSDIHASAFDEFLNLLCVFFLFSKPYALLLDESQAKTNSGFTKGSG